MTLIHPVLGVPEKKIKEAQVHHIHSVYPSVFLPVYLCVYVICDVLGLPEFLCHTDGWVTWCHVSNMKIQKAQVRRMYSVYPSVYLSVYICLYVICDVLGLPEFLRTWASLNFQCLCYTYGWVTWRLMCCDVKIQEAQVRHIYCKYPSVFLPVYLCLYVTCDVLGLAEFWILMSHMDEWHEVICVVTEGFRKPKHVTHVWMSPVSHIHESCHACEWFMSHTWHIPMRPCHWHWQGEEDSGAGVQVRVT